MKNGSRKLVLLQLHPKSGADDSPYPYTRGRGYIVSRFARAFLELTHSQARQSYLCLAKKCSNPIIYRSNSRWHGLRIEGLNRADYSPAGSHSR